MDAVETGVLDCFVGVGSELQRMQEAYGVDQLGCLRTAAPVTSA